mmetsp:Transcript_31289/g.43366  ORF Transcript_31289/g.43366 Transcript_31289/m.43366 type:complete len:222 (+) Transcript_31289:447-1112(+)
MRAPVVRSIPFTLLPCGPITLPSRSFSTVTDPNLGALARVASRGEARVCENKSRSSSRASRAQSRASIKISRGRPAGLISSCAAVIPCRVPASLKSMSPWWSSRPMMSVRRVPGNEDSLEAGSLDVSSEVSSTGGCITNPTETPATCSSMGMPASIRAKLPLHTAAMDEDPLDPVISEFTRTQNGKVASLGRTPRSAFSARAPCPISLRESPPSLRHSFTA